MVNLRCRVKRSSAELILSRGKYYTIIFDSRKHVNPSNTNSNYYLVHTNQYNYNSGWKSIKPLKDAEGITDL